MGEGRQGTLWKYRNSVCSTWFCRYERGIAGYDFWETTKNLLASIEADLSSWCIAELEIGGDAMEVLFKTRLPREPNRIDLDSLESRNDPKTQRRVWGKWLGREQEFFRECARLVTRLNWQGVLSACGPLVRVRALLLKQAHEQLAAGHVPARLRLGSFTVVESGPDSYRVHNATFGLESFRLSARLMGLLSYFDGRPTTEVVQQIIEEKKLRINPRASRPIGRLQDTN